MAIRFRDDGFELQFAVHDRITYEECPVPGWFIDEQVSIIQSDGDVIIETAEARVALDRATVNSLCFAAGPTYLSALVSEAHCFVATYDRFEPPVRWPVSNARRALSYGRARRGEPSIG